MHVDSWDQKEKWVHPESRGLWVYQVYVVAVAKMECQVPRETSEILVMLGA